MGLGVWPGVWQSRHLLRGWVPAESQECVMEVTARQNCGFPGISPEECAAKKCCFSDDIPNVPWCFFPIPVEGEWPRGPLLL